MQDKKTINEDIHRINQIMVQEEGNLILEQGPEAKIVNELLDNLITPKRVVAMMGDIGFDVVDMQKKFLTRYDDLVLYADDPKLWNGVIESGVELKTIKQYFHNGVEISKAEYKKIDIDTDMVDDVTKTVLNTQTNRYKVLATGNLQQIDEVEYKHLVSTNGDFFSIPEIIRLPNHEIVSLLNDVTEPGIKTVEDFVRSFQVFLKSGNLSGDLKKAIMALMANNSGFSKALVDELVGGKIKTALQRQFVKRLRYAHYMGKLDSLVAAISDATGLKETSRLLNDIKVKLSRKGQLLEKYFSFLFRKVSPIKLWKSVRFGDVVGWQKWTKLIIADVFASGFYNYIMGGVFLKSAFRYVVKLTDSEVKSSKKITDALLRLVAGSIIFGVYKNLRDESWDNTHILPWFTGLLESISRCLGDDKVSDALTGRLYKNVVGNTLEGQDGNIIKCGEVEFTVKFIESYSMSENDAKLAAEALYATLNNNAHDGNWWSYAEKGVSDGSEDVEEGLTVFGFNVQQIPSITKIIQDQIGAWRPDSMIIEDILGKGEMDILKMSQIAHHYETNFMASLYDDMQNINQWAELFGGADWESMKVEINKLPYLNGAKKGDELTGQSKKHYDTWLEMTKLNESHLLRFPEKIVWYDGDFSDEIILAKCGAGCKNGDKECNCGAGGCKLGGTLVSTPLGIKLNEAGVITNQEFETWCKGKEGFTKLKTMFDEVEAVGVGSRSACVLRPGGEVIVDTEEVIDTEEGDE